MHWMNSDAGMISEGDGQYFSEDDEGISYADNIYETV